MSRPFGDPPESDPSGSDPFGSDPREPYDAGWGDDGPPELAGAHDGWKRPRRGRRGVALVALILVVALALGATSLFWTIISPAGRASSGGPQMGDCLAVDATGTYRPVDCGDPAAAVQVLAPSVDRDGCVDVPGVGVAYRSGGGYLCLGERGVDRARSLNGVRAGNCVTGSTSSASPFQRSACDAGALRVLAVVPDVSTAVGASSDDLLAVCERAGARDVAQTYAWGITDPDQPDPATWDRLLCLTAAA